MTTIRRSARIAAIQEKYSNSVIQNLHRLLHNVVYPNSLVLQYMYYIRDNFNYLKSEKYIQALSDACTNLDYVYEQKFNRGLMTRKQFYEGIKLFIQVKVKCVSQLNKQ